MQVIYTIGQRLIFFFPITTMWLMGPSVMLITSTIVTTCIFFLDRWDPHKPEHHMADVLKLPCETAHHPEALPQAAPDVVVMHSNPLQTATPPQLKSAPHAAPVQGEIDMAKPSQVKAEKGEAENGGEIAVAGAQYAIVGASAATSMESFKSL
jgi:hypothetical protein